MTTTALKNRAVLRHTPASSALVRAWATICLWRERARQRGQLADMSREMLADVGISASAARAEAGKPFWVD